MGVGVGVGVGVGAGAGTEMLRPSGIAMALVKFNDQSPGGAGIPWPVAMKRAK